MKLLINLLFFIRQFFLKIGEKLFNQIRDPETGKISGSWFKDKRNVRTFLLTVGVVFFLFVVFYKIFTGNVNPIDGAKDFSEEMTGKTGINATEIKEFEKNIGDPLAFLQVGQGSRTGTSPDQRQERPDYSVCIRLLDKLKSGLNLNLDEKEQLQYCLENNIVGLTPEELALAKMLAESSILDRGEKALMNELFGNEKACQDVIDSQMTRADGNNFLTKIIEDPVVNSTVIELLRDQDLLRRLLINDNALKNRVGFTDSEISFLKQLLENCSTDLLLRMLSDPRYKELIGKLLKEAVNNPNFLRNILEGQDLSDSEKALLRKYLSGTLDPSSDDYQIAEALLSSNPLNKRLAQDILKARELGDFELSNALTKKLTGDPMSESEKNLADNYDSRALDSAYVAKLQGNQVLSDALLKQAKNVPLTDSERRLLSNLDDLGVADLDDKALMMALQEDMARRQAEIDRLSDMLAEAQRRAQEAAERLARGDTLTPEQQKALQDYADLQKRLEELLSQQQRRQDQYAKKATELYNFLNQSGRTIQQIFPSGLRIEGGERFAECSELPPFKIVKVLKKKTPRKQSKQLLADGREATPEQVRILKAYRKMKEDEARNAQDQVAQLFNPMGEDFIGNATSLNESVASNQGGGSGMNGLFVSENNNLKPFKLSPDTVVPAILLTEILVSDKGGSQRVRVKILQDIYDPMSGKLVIPRNSIAFGNSGSFDVDTGTMQLTLDQVAAGRETMNVSFAVGSGDLSPGLRGEVRDTRGKLLVGTFITSFTAGALGAIAQNYIAPFQDSTLLADTMTGAALTGASEIAQRIAEMYAGDLQNAPRLFYVPTSVPVVLIPTN